MLMHNVHSGTFVRLGIGSINRNVIMVSLPNYLEFNFSRSCFSDIFFPFHLQKSVSVAGVCCGTVSSQSQRFIIAIEFNFSFSYCFKGIFIESNSYRLIGSSCHLIPFHNVQFRCASRICYNQREKIANLL